METADPLWKYKLNKRKPVGTILAPIFSDPSTISTTCHSKGNRSNRLLQGNETGRVGGTNTGTTVLDGLAVGVVSNLVQRRRIVFRPREEGKRRKPNGRLQHADRRTMR